MSRGASTGFATWSFIPAAKQSSTSPLVALAVRATIGVAPDADGDAPSRSSARMRRAAS
jgi:hypothetical protein